MGEKPTVILIHGVLATQNTWKKLLPYLVLKGYRVIAPTLPFENSTIRPDPFEAAKYVKHVVGHYRFNKPIFLIGHSFGGLVAKAFLLKYGNEIPIKSIITLASPHLGVRWSKRIVKHLLELIEDFEGDEKMRIIKWNFYSIRKVFSYNSEIVKELNKAFEYKEIKFLLIGAYDQRFRMLTPVGDGVVELDSQVPPEFIKKENVEHFVFYNVGHTQIQKIPGTRDLIHRFLKKTVG